MSFCVHVDMKEIYNNKDMGNINTMSVVLMYEFIWNKEK